MDYFFMEEDRHSNNIVKVNLSTEAFKTQDHQVVFTEISDKIDCPDYILKRIFTNNFHLVSNDLYELINLYCPDLRGYSLFLTDKGRLVQKHYWSIFPEQVDCLISNKKTDEQVLDGEKIADRHFFCVAKAKANYIITDLCLTENILRKYPFGVAFSPVDVLRS